METLTICEGRDSVPKNHCSMFPLVCVLPTREETWLESGCCAWYSQPLLDCVETFGRWRNGLGSLGSEAWWVFIFTNAFSDRANWVRTGAEQGNWELNMLQHDGHGSWQVLHSFHLHSSIVALEKGESPSVAVWSGWLLSGKPSWAAEICRYAT